MFGKKKNKKTLLAAIARRRITIYLIVTGLVLPSIIGYAIYDFVATAKKKDDFAQSAALKGEAAQFAIGIRDEEGVPLADNPNVLSPLNRSNQIIPISKQFFVYFLNRANAKNFETANLVWRPPNSCSVDFSFGNAQVSPNVSLAGTVRTCFATVKNDPTGRYLYFSMRYPAASITRHLPGDPLSSSSRVRIEFIGTKTTKIDIVYGTPTLAKERYPSHKLRFQKIHELSGYVADERSLIRSFNGQAFEKPLEIGRNNAENYVTLLGRVDANTLLASGDDFSALQNLKISVSIFDAGVENSTNPSFSIPSSMQGESAISLEKLYRSRVLSRGTLDLYDLRVSSDKPIWQSKSLFSNIDATPSGFQRFTDWLAAFIGETFNFKREADIARQEILGPTLYVTLKEEKASLPDIATRSLFFLILALIIILVFESLWYRDVINFKRVVRTAYRFAVAPRNRDELGTFKGNDELSMLGRTVNLLIKKSRLRNDGVTRREKRDREKSILKEQHIKTRQRILDAIGHEIRSPLQTLMNRTQGEDLRVLERMDRAIKALTEATSVEAGIKNSKIVNTVGDLAEYLQKLCNNSASTLSTVYQGKCSSVFAKYDEIILEQVISHVLDNAARLRTPGTNISIKLIENDESVRIEIFNHGFPIEEHRLDSIFELGESSGKGGNFGQGLFVAQTYIVFGMKGSIFARNDAGGVTFVIDLPEARVKKDNL